MPRSVAEIQADIDRVKAQIAYNQKYSQGFAQPSTKVGWNSYIINNDRGLLDAYQARENAWKQQQANADMQREIAAINKSESENDKRILKNKEVNKDMLAAELAQAEYDEAVSKVDLDNPASVLAAKKAAIKLNYANKNLPYYADDPKSFTVSTDFTEDAPSIAKDKRVKSAVSYLDTLTDIPTKMWTPEQREEYKAKLDILKNDAPDLVQKYTIEISKKGATTEDNERAELKRLRGLRDTKSNMTSKQRKRLAELETKYK